MKDKKIIAIVGMPGSGKSTVVQYLVKNYKLPFLHFGQITIEEIHKRGLPEGQENEKKVRQELRKQYGMAAYAQLSLPKIKDLLQQHSIILIDGLYSWSEYTLLRTADVGNLILVTVISKRETRYSRLANREYRPLSPIEAEKRDFAEIQDLEKGGPIALCDYYITNDCRLEEFEHAIANIAQELGLEKDTNEK